MLIAQITDTHVRAPDAPARLGVDNNGNLCAAIRFLERMQPRPDVVLHTGDLVNRGDAEEYVALRGLLSELHIPLYVVAGNHDDRERMRGALDGRWFARVEGKFIHYVIDEYAVRLVAVDTTRKRHHDGALCATRLQWLAARLAEAPDKPTLIFMHHPPFKTGIWWIDGIGLLRGREQLQQLMQDNSQVRLIVCGHIHRSIESQLGGRPVSVAPSTVHQVALDLMPEHPPAFVAEPPALKLHHWNGKAFVSHTVYFDNAAAPIDLTRYMDWEERRKIIRNGKSTPKRVNY